MNLYLFVCILVHMHTCGWVDGWMDRWIDQYIDAWIRVDVDILTNIFLRYVAGI